MTLSLMAGAARERLWPPSIAPNRIFVLAFSHQAIREATMAKQKATTRAAAKTAVKKKWTGHKGIAKSSARKTIKSKGRVTAAKAKTASNARPKQRIAISH